MPHIQDTGDPRIAERIDQWVATRNLVAVGNIGEQIAARLVASYRLPAGRSRLMEVISWS